MNPWLPLLLLIPIGLAGLWTLLVFRTAWYLTHPNPRHTPKGYAPDFDPSVLGLEPVQIESRTGMTLMAWIARPKHHPASVILCHGVWTNHKEMVGRCVELLKLGYGVVLFDFSGHGESEGSTTTMGYREMLDLLGVVDWAADHVELGRLAVWGNSMGGSVAIMAAALDERLEAVIADSPFATLRENVARAFKRITGLPPWLFVGPVVWLGQRLVGHRMDHIRPVDLVASLHSRPLMVVQSGQDSIVSAESTRKLFEAATSAEKHLWVIDDAEHVEGFHILRDEYLAKISEFLRHSLREPVEKQFSRDGGRKKAAGDLKLRPGDAPGARRSAPTPKH